MPCRWSGIICRARILTSGWCCEAAHHSSLTRSLDEMIKLYTEGTELAGECNKALEEAQLKISKLNEESEDEDEF